MSWKGQGGQISEIPQRDAPQNLYTLKIRRIERSPGGRRARQPEIRGQHIHNHAVGRVRLWKRQIIRAVSLRHQSQTGGQALGVGHHNLALHIHCRRPPNCAPPAAKGRTPRLPVRAGYTSRGQKPPRSCHGTRHDHRRSDPRHPQGKGPADAAVRALTGKG